MSKIASKNGSKLGKRLAKASELVDGDRLYSLEDASALIEQFPKAKFDESVDLAINLGVDPKKAEENIRGTVSLPHGTGKTVRVVAFCRGDKAKEAETAGADVVGAEDLIAKIQDGWLDFDAAVATPDVMPLIGKVAKVLGPRGLMPTPKTGTVTTEVGKVIASIKAGRVEFRVEKAGIIHMGIGKTSFGKQKIIENAKMAIDAVLKSKPSSSKGVYLKAISMSTTMGPGIGVNTIEFK